MIADSDDCIVPGLVLIYLKVDTDVCDIITLINNDS